MGLEETEEMIQECLMNDPKEAPEEMQSQSSSSCCSWRPTSQSKLASVEEKILKAYVKNHYRTKYVSLPNTKNKLWTIIVNGYQESKVPIVLVHGMGGGIGLWAQNLDSLSQNRTLYAFDLLGFGRSSRPVFGTEPEVAEGEFVESIEEWRQEMKIGKMILLGHSLGAYISSAYTLKYPQNVQHLILVDSWGFAGKPSPEQLANIPLIIRIIGNIVKHFNPLAVIRAAGPCGPRLVKRFRSDLREKFADVLDDYTISDYIYHCNAQTPSGEAAFKTLSSLLGWAKNPMLDRMVDIRDDVPITMIHGAKSWVDRTIGYQVKYLRRDSYVDVAVVKGAGHHVYADEPYPFNQIVLRICDSIDKNVLPQRMSFRELYNMQKTPEPDRKNGDPDKTTES